MASWRFSQCDQVEQARSICTGYLVFQGPCTLTQQPNPILDKNSDSLGFQSRKGAPTSLLKYTCFLPHCFSSPFFFLFRHLRLMYSTYETFPLPSAPQPDFLLLLPDFLTWSSLHQPSCPGRLLPFPPPPQAPAWQPSSHCLSSTLAGKANACEPGAAWTAASPLRTHPASNVTQRSSQ